MLVVSSKEKLVTASEVLARGPQPQPTMETVIITLMHLALQSEKIELEVYMLFLLFRMQFSMGTNFYFLRRVDN